MNDYYNSKIIKQQRPPTKKKKKRVTILKKNVKGTFELLPLDNVEALRVAMINKMG